jgi:hypothetical protein
MGHDGKVAHCVRDEFAGGLPLEQTGTYAHWLDGDCRCGTRHGEPSVASLDDARARRASDGPRVINTIHYDYEGGLRVVRQDLEGGGKNIFQQHRDGQAFAKGRGDAPLTLYRARELRAAPTEAFVFVVEGEKCVDALRVPYGLVAVTTPGGAGRWKATEERAAELLKGRHVVILPDNDDPGRGYAADARATLVKVAASLRVLELPGLPSKGDVVDWLRAGGDPEDLVRMAERQPDLVENRRLPLVAAAARALWREPLPPVVETGLRGLDRVIGGLRAESFAILNAPPGRGKSCLTIQVTRFIGQTGRSVIYLSSELSARQVIARMVAQVRRCSWLRVFESDPSEAELVARDLEGLPIRVVRLQRGMAIRDVLDRVADEDGAPPILALDYLQHAARRLAIEDRRIAVGLLVDEIGTWSTDTRSSGLVVSSVSRGNYQPDDNATAEDFLGAGKEAGEIECDASVELFLQTELPPEGGSAPAKLHISKHRFGPTGLTVGLLFDGAIGMFRDDPRACLGDLEAECIREIEAGARSASDVLDRLKSRDKGVRKESVLKAIRSLQRNGLVDGPPLTVRGNEA